MTWIAKGILLSIWLFSFGWLFYALRLYFAPRVGQASGLFGAELLLPVSNPSFWFWLITCLAIGLLIARSWPGRPALWIGLAITEIIPISMLTMIFLLLNRSRTVMK